MGMFKLAETRGSSRSLYCGVEGLYLGPSPLIEFHDGTYRVRPPHEIAALVAAAFDPPPDTVKLLARLYAIAADLQHGDLGQAMISAVLLGFGVEQSGRRRRRLARAAETLLKFNFNQAEPRDRQGRWTRDTAAGTITPIRAGGPSGGSPAPAARVWESQPNAEFRNRLATAEGNVAHASPISWI